MSKIKITLNGEEKLFDEGISVEKIIENLGLDTKKIAIERNLQIVFPKDFSKTILSDSDRIEIVHFIGGG